MLIQKPDCYACVTPSSLSSESNRPCRRAGPVCNLYAPVEPEPGPYLALPYHSSGLVRDILRYVPLFRVVQCNMSVCERVESFQASYGISG